MGTNKASLEIDGLPMAQRCAEALNEAGVTDVISVGGSLGASNRWGMAHIPDLWPGEGPLGGIITALEHLDVELLVVLPCDLIAPTPLSIVELINSIDGSDAVVPLVDDREQWLTSVWHRRSLDHLRTEFRGGVRSIRRAARALQMVHPIVATGINGPGPFDDADTPADFQQLRPRSPR